MITPKLSILVITHNQRELLKRCLDSVLGQKLNVPFEVIVSDDRSVDGTAEYMASIIDSWKGGKLTLPNLVNICYTPCNSNDCDPKNISERCGWNKLNAYQHANGEYFVNIDADDYLKSDTIYQAQLDMLMAHPECSMCMQGVLQVSDGDPIEKGRSWFPPQQLQNGQILELKDIISKNRALNQCYMIRRHPEVDCAALYGKYFDDTIITLHHMQFGLCVYLQRDDYVWVQYDTSITKTLIGDDSVVEYGLIPLLHVRMIPVFATAFMEDGLCGLNHMLKMLSRKQYLWTLTERTQASFRETPGRIYRILTHSQSTFFDRVYLRFLRLLTSFYRRYNIKKWKFLYSLLISREAANKISWN